MFFAQRHKNRIHFVGLEHLHWPTGASEGTRSWSFEHMIDTEKISVGSRIAIMREKPPQSTPLPSWMPNARPTHSSPIPLLEGEVLGLRNTNDGNVIFTISDDFAGGLTTVQVPAKFTTLDKGGGWAWSAKPLALGRNRGWTLKYPTRVGASSLRRPRTRRAQPRAQSPTSASLSEV